jgi:hypothetical protein
VATVRHKVWDEVTAAPRAVLSNQRMYSPTTWYCPDPVSGTTCNVRHSVSRLKQEPSASTMASGAASLRAVRQLRRAHYSRICHLGRWGPSVCLHMLSAVIGNRCPDKTLPPPRPLGVGVACRTAGGTLTFSPTGPILRVGQVDGYRRHNLPDPALRGRPCFGQQCH